MTVLALGFVGYLAKQALAEEESENSLTSSEGGKKGTDASR